MLHVHVLYVKRNPRSSSSTLLSQSAPFSLVSVGDVVAPPLVGQDVAVASATSAAPLATTCSPPAAAAASAAFTACATARAILRATTCFGAPRAAARSIQSLGTMGPSTAIPRALTSPASIAAY